MSAQTAAKRKAKDWDPVTPVIIKSGGGGGGGGTYVVPVSPSSVSIDSPIMAFTEVTPGLTWESSRSTETGRITNVTVKDGKELVGTTITPTDELVSIVITYAVDTLNVLESRPPGQDGVVLLIQSPEVPFNLLQSIVLPAGEWNDSKTTFPNSISSIVVQVGNQDDFFHQCKTQDVTIHISFDLG